MKVSRRQALMTTLFGAGAIGLRALATGIPAAVLLDPRRALADNTTCFDKDKAQFLILNTSAGGDPIGCNAPGMYDDPNIFHPNDPLLAPTQFALGDKTVTAAKPWSTLGKNVLARTCFFHHATKTSAHGDEDKVLRLMGGTNRNEMLASVLAKALAPCLGTVQPQPVSLGGTTITFEGRPLPVLQPTGIAAMLAKQTGALADLDKMRATDLDRLNAIVKSSGNNVQRDFIDRYATSRSQVKNISQDLLSVISGLTDNDADSQITAAVTLIRMNISPVMVVNIPFGQDNHTDPGFQLEIGETVSGMATLNNLMTQLAAAGLTDKVTFASMNVFGRTLRQVYSGRGHNGDHHCTVMIGKGIKGGVAGGVQLGANDQGKALPIDSKTGAASASGDIAFVDGLAAAGTTLGRAVGLDPKYLQTQIPTGVAVSAVLA